MGRTIELHTEDQQTISAYRADPAGSARGGIVILQEIWGVNSHIRSVTDSYAAEGYLAIAPALFDRVEPGVIMDQYNDETRQRGFACKSKVDTARALLDIRAAAQIGSQAGRVGIVGFCFGGLLAWLAATRLDGVAASVSYYGGGIQGVLSEQPRCPVMLHFGERDASIPLTAVEELKTLHPTLPVYLYPAGHGFSCDQRASYDAPSARLARERTLEFLRQHVG